MSAFNVSTETIDKCVFLATEFISLPSRECRDRIGQRLIDMNQEAVNVRYREADEPSPGYKYSGKRYEIVDAIKAADCLIYQSSEGDIPESCADYKTIEDVRNRACRNLVRNLPEYDDAPWG